MITTAVKRAWEVRHLIYLLLPLALIAGVLIFNFGYLAVEFLADKPPEVQDAEATYLEHARNGDELAQSLLAWSYLKAGYLRSARDWYEKSVGRDDIDSMVTLGDLYMGRYSGTRAHVGQLIRADYEKAIPLYERVHDFGDPRGTQRLCFLYAREGYVYENATLKEHYCALANAEKPK